MVCVHSLGLSFCHDGKIVALVVWNYVHYAYWVLADTTIMVIPKVLWFQVWVCSGGTSINFLRRDRNEIFHGDKILKTITSLILLCAAHCSLPEPLFFPTIHGSLSFHIRRNGGGIFKQISTLPFLWHHHCLKSLSDFTLADCTIKTFIFQIVSNNEKEFQKGRNI